MADRETDLLAMEESTLKAMEIDEGRHTQLRTPRRKTKKTQSGEIHMAVDSSKPFWDPILVGR